MSVSIATAITAVFLAFIAGQIFNMHAHRFYERWRSGPRLPPRRRKPWTDE